MSLLDMFQERVGDVKETGVELRIVMSAVRRMLTVIPDDDEVLRQQRERRNELRDGGRSITVSAIHSCDDTDDEEEEKARSGSASSSSSSSFVSPNTMDAAAGFPASEALADAEFAAALAKAEPEESEEDRMARYYTARMKLESNLQLRLFDNDPRQWLLSFICLATKVYTEEIDQYLLELQTLLSFMAARRRRIEQRSALLRERCDRAASSAQQKTDGGEEAAKEGGTADVESDANEDTEQSDEEARRVAVNLPDHMVRTKLTTLSSFFSLYVAVLMRHEAPVTILKRVCEEALNLCHSLRTCQRDPVDILAQLRDDRASQSAAFLEQWLLIGEGRLAPVMLAPPEAKPAVDGESSTDDNTVGSDSETGSNVAFDRSPSTVSGSSLLATVPEEGTRHAAAESTEDEEGAAHLSPPVDSATAEQLVADYCVSRTPATCALTRLVMDTVPGMGPTALLPCIEQPERRQFNGGFVRLAPYMTPAEEELLTRWMQVRLTELADEYTPAGESALVRAWASPTYDARAGELTVLVNPTNAFRMQLSNPASFSPSGMQCDMCCLSGRRVSFQAVLDSGVRSEVIIGYEGCIGYDVCIACSYAYYKECEVRLLRAIHPNPAVRQPFAHGRFSKVVVQSVRVIAADEEGQDGAATAVAEVVMGVSPFGVLPVGWVLPRDRLDALADACSLSDEYVELTEAEHAALPVPGPQWQEACDISNVSKKAVEGQAAEDDLCPICLQLLHGPLPILRTQCGHWFHVECIGSHYHYKPAEVDGEVNEANGCPVCRHSDYMPSLTNVEETLRSNVYRLRICLPRSEEPFAIAVGTVLTSDGGYFNATNVAACAAYFNLTPGYTFTAAVAEEEGEGDVGEGEGKSGGVESALVAPPAVEATAETESEQVM